MSTTNFTRKAAAFSALALVLDQTTKTLVRLVLAPCAGPPASQCDRVPVAGPAALIRLENAGSALGFAQGLLIWTVLAAAALIVVALLPRWAGASRLMAAGSGLLLGGAAGNLLDRLLFGHVTDFLGFSWATGGGIVINGADLALLAGAILATWALYRALFRPRPEGASPHIQSVAGVHLPETCLPAVCKVDKLRSCVLLAFPCMVALVGPTQEVPNSGRRCKR